MGAQLLNFGALIAFMGVNASSFTRYFLHADKRKFSNLIVPFLGFSICLFLWFSLGLSAKIVGMCWLIAGVMYGAYRTSWFRKPLSFVPIENGND
jgi:hypothetical protein